MDLKVENQYSYFIYPFYIKRGRYKEFTASLVNSDKWHFKILNETEDQKTASFFLPDVRKFLFPTLDWSNDEKEAFKKLSQKEQINKIIMLPKATFKYNLEKPIRALLNIKEDKMTSFFITKIKILTFEQGAGILIFKTILDDKHNKSFEDVLDFNYSFREINLFHENLKEDEASVVCEHFKNEKTVSQIIKHILNGFIDVEKESIYYDRLFTYSYVCLEESEWNEEKAFGDLIYEFFKFKHVLPGDFKSKYYDNFMKRDETSYSRWTYSMYGFLKESGVVLGSASDPFNCSQLANYFETVYYYIFILAIYQRMMLILLSRELAAGGTKRIGQLRAYLLKFTNISWFNQITNSEQGMDIWKKWQKVFELPTLFEEVQREYTEYYEYTFAKSQDRINRFLVYIFVMSVFFPGISLLIQFKLIDTQSVVLRTIVIATLSFAVLYYPILSIRRKLQEKL